jgi:NTE family protein
MKRVSLVLGSGGARGLAHVGVIKWLEENNYEIKSISGCSMGALIGGYYAAGKLDNFVEWIKEVDTLDLLRLLDLKGSGGLVSGETLMEKLKELLGNPLIEELPIKYTAVAANIDTEKEVWINKGPLLDAIRASISLPLFFSPYIRNGEPLIDGGVLNPVPIAPTFHDSTELTIAVNLNGEISEEHLIKDTQKKLSISKKIKEFKNKEPLSASILNQYNIYEIADKSFESMQSTIARMKLSAYPPDIEINIPKNLCGTFEFTKAKEVIEYGYNQCSINAKT